VDDDESDFTVGYKKPPRETRFKPGQSGNLNGRPKKTTSTFAETLARELNTTITLSKGGKSTKMTKRDAIAKQLTIKAVNGDHKATALVMKAVEPREIDTKVDLFPLFAEMRAINARHETANPFGTPKPASSGLNDKLENDGAEQQ
jgi:hypothetical protein